MMLSCLRAHILPYVKQPPPHTQPRLKFLRDVASNRIMAGLKIDFVEDKIKTKTKLNFFNSLFIV